VLGLIRFVCLFVFVTEAFRNGINFVEAYFSLMNSLKMGFDRSGVLLVSVRVLAM